MTANFALYARPRLLAVMCLGFSSGLPLALTGETFNIWLTEQHVSLTSIGFFSLAGLVYSLKYLWAPLLDQLSVPILTKRLGRRRSWTLTIQTALVIAIIGLGLSDPATQLEITALWAVAVAFLSASQDVVIDAYRVELLSEAEQGAGAGAVTLGYRFGMIASGAGALLIADHFGWRAAFLTMACMVSVGMVTVLRLREPAFNRLPRQPRWLAATFVAPFRDFIQRRGWLIVLIFVALYNLGDAMAGRLSGPFYIGLGFTKTEIAGVSKVFGIIATLAGALLGGIGVARFGIMRSMLIFGIIKMAANLLYLAQLSAGHNLWMLTATLGTENLAIGAASSAFVAYISRLCNPAFTATQYALLSALATLARTFLSSGGGFLADRFGWASFFMISVALALPSLLLLLWLMKHPMDRVFPADGHDAAG